MDFREVGFGHGNVHPYAMKCPGYGLTFVFHTFLSNTNANIADRRKELVAWILNHPSICKMYKITRAI
jgi:hypothetical protein